MRLHYLFYCFCLCLAPLLNSANSDTTLRLDKVQWQKLTDGVDYTERFKSKEEKKDNKSNNTQSNFDFNFKEFRYVIYFLVLALVIFLSIRVFKSFNNNAAIENKVVTVKSFREIEENIHEVNLEELLRNAVLSKDYRIALRLNFLIIIKLLSQKGKIEWAKEKTNWEYYTELRDKLTADSFKEIILSFENFWYGEHPLSEFQYHVTEPLYRKFQSKLSGHE